MLLFGLGFLAGMVMGLILAAAVMVGKGDDDGVGDM